MKIQWGDSMSTGVAKLDEQHRELIAMINELGQSLEQHSGREEIDKTLTFIVEYAQKHFELEEEYFAKYNCPVEINKKEHKKFLDKFSILVIEFSEKGNELLLGVNLYRELSSWLLGHIMSVDVKLRDYVEKGKA